jgi:Domain of unknown function (DUF3854)
VNAPLDFLMSCLYDDLLAPEHRADLRKSGLTDETIAEQKIRTVPSHMIDQLLGFPAPDVRHAYLIPFPDPRGGWFDHVRLKIFPTLTTDKGTIKYLQPKRSGVRIYFPLATLDAVLHSADPLYICEGEKKALSVAQLGRPVVGICGVEGWHLAGSRELHPDLDDVGLDGRLVDLLPDGDWKTNPDVNRAVMRLAEACERRRAVARLVVLPETV